MFRSKKPVKSTEILNFLKKYFLFNAQNQFSESNM